MCGAPWCRSRSHGIVHDSRVTRTPQLVRDRRPRRAQPGSRPMSTSNPSPLWQPTEERIAQAQITKFQTWAAERHGAPAEGGYAALHRWSVDELDTFWKAVTE